MGAGPAEETGFLRSVQIARGLQFHWPQLWPWDLVLTCSPTPSFQPEQAAPGILISHSDFQSDFEDRAERESLRRYLSRWFGLLRLFARAASAVAMVSGLPSADGKSTVAPRQSSDRTSVSEMRTARGGRAFTSPLSRTLNHPSNLIGHDRLQAGKRRKGV